MKAVLVIDLLEDYNLDELKAYVEVSFKDNNQILCGLFNRELKPLPQKRILPEEQVIGTNYGEEPWFSDGFNACIDEILGEAE